MSNQFEIISTHDKNARDQIFEELRHSDLLNERQVVKFLDCELILNGLPHGELTLDKKNRVVYRSTFSVAYPRHEESDETKTRRRSQRDRRQKMRSLGELHSDRDSKNKFDADRSAIMLKKALGIEWTS